MSQLIEALPQPMPMPVPDTETMAAATQLLASCVRPVIVVGGGAHEAAAEVQELAERLGAPVFTRRQGHGVLDARHRLWAPMPVGHEFWRDADVAIGIGTRMEFPITQWGTDDDLAIVQINVDADELDRHELGTLGLHGDAQATIRQLLDSLAGEELAAQDRTAEIASHRAAFESESAALAPQRAFLEAIRDAMPDDGVFVEDVTQLGFAAHVAFEFRQPRTFLTSGVAGTLGACVAQAVGAQSATDRPVLGIVGDGGFLFSSAELASAVQHDIPVTILLHDNNAYGNVKGIQAHRFGEDRLIASTLVNPDFVAMGQSFNIESERVHTADELGAALRRAFAHDGPSLVVLATGDMPSPWPWLLMPRVRG